MLNRNAESPGGFLIEVRAMHGLTICLFGRFTVRRNEQVVGGLDARRVQELLAYLLLHRGHPQSREALAGLLWADSANEQARKYLRQALWHLHVALSTNIDPMHNSLCQVEPEWILLNPQADLWLDVAAFEAAYNLSEGMSCQDLDGQCVQALREAVRLYQGDLLEGCYLDWCLIERERLKAMYLAMLDKLMGYSEVEREYEAGLGYGMRILTYDRASERTHRCLMRLQYLAGDRTAALRQYQRCVAALSEELDAKPSQRTVALYEQIRADRLDSQPLAASEAGTPPELRTGSLVEALDSLNRMMSVLSDLHEQILQHMKTAGPGLKPHR